MDESYLEWLQVLPGFDEEKARRVAERFPTFDHLLHAGREELATVAALSPVDIATLLAFVSADSGRDDSSHLFLCPECGSFAGGGAKSCPVCGVAFEEGASEDLSQDLETFIEEEDHPGLLCSTCGAAMTRGASRCNVCGRAYRPEEAALLPGLDAFLEEESSLCVHCGAYISAGLAECTICGRGPAIPGDAAQEVPGAKGIGRGFLSRWAHVSETPEIGEKDRLLDELDYFTRLLETDPTLESVWAKKARVLQGLGRSAEAVDALGRAAELNPAKEEEYHLEVLDILRSQGDVLPVPPRWSHPKATEAPRQEDARLVQALQHYEDLLRADSSLAVAWRTKGEILERLGRDADAREVLERAEFLERHEGRGVKAAVAGLQTRGIVGLRAPEGGRVNGRTNGHVNGRTNGHVNGRVNGLTNGLTNGHVNGLSFFQGATNGLVNGNGFTNGRRGRQAPRPVPAQPHWARSVVGIAAVVALMVLAPVLASLLSPVAGPVATLRIDGEFSDWAAFASYADSAGDQLANPDVNLVSAKIAAKDAGLFVYARVQGVLFRGIGAEGADSLFVFVDEDDDSSTGYAVGGIGADVVAEAYGWNGALRGSSRRSFDATSGARSDDWNRFRAGGPLAVDFRGQEIELKLPDIQDTSRARVLVYFTDNRGNRDAADGVVKPSRPTLVVEPRTVLPGVVVGTSATALQVGLAPLGGPVSAAALNLTRLGSSADPVTLSLYADDGDGSRSPADRLLSTVPMAGPVASLAMQEEIAGPMILWVDALWASISPEYTFGLRVTGVATNGTESLRPQGVGLAYLAAAPTFVIVDGAFADWSGRSYGSDVLGDVVNRTGSVQYDANVDLLATAVDLAANFTAYARVDGRILGGDDLPTTRKRDAPASALDTDLDGVPDAVEVGLDVDLADDFNNDNITDATTPNDVDADGLFDYPDGPDLWLNTTIPAWYPAPYAGRSVSRYIGLLAPTIQEGVDILYVYIDADNSTATGLRSDLDGSTYGFDGVLAVVGRNGEIASAGRYAYAAGSDAPWAYAGPVVAALDARRIELAVNASPLGLLAGYRTAFFASDWRKGYDVATPDATTGSFLVAPRVDATTVVINEVSPQPNPEWIELVNPTGSAVFLAGWDIVVVRGNKVVLVYTFTTQILGAWGSGTEYLGVSPSANSFPNGNIQVRLRQNGVVVDQTTYSASAGSGRSWARFKDPISGVPMDSNNDAADFYVSMAPSPGRGNDRHGPSITVGKVADRALAVPGELVTYTIYYNNTGTGLAKTVWVNDTLPAGVSFVGSSVAPTTVAGSTYGWVFTNVGPGSSNALTVTVQVNGVGVDGSLQTNAVSLEYTDQLRRLMPASQAWASVTVSRPVIVVSKTVSPGAAVPADFVTYTIYYNNTGSASAGTVSIRDALPSGLSYVSGSPAPSGISGSSLWWNFTNVAPGSYSLTFTVLVEPAANGSTLVNWAFLNYTSTLGYALPGTNSSTILAIPELTDFVFVLAVPLVILAIRRYRRKAEKEEGVADSAPRAGGR
ncbi:MAG: hypothetical protein A3K68_06610 [Euryarchaeota archaeon RBG_16_68_13]|nr:MAG: hypothetical protein A3K68_06610 [Euryarchaeota archaeon RBG_16_68_13]